jgi:NADPH-dependent glutamate synthase beta subunit-like oxidoreductase
MVVEGRTYKPVILSERCHSCDVCLRGCPAELLPEYREEEKSLRGGLYRKRISTAPEKVPLPPCQAACPIGQDTKGYVALVARGKFREALELIREVNPLPAVCGFICHHPCEEACLREEVDHPIPIRLLKRFVSEYERKGERIKRRPGKKRRERILVIGSGPAGLAAANDLRLLGYEVTVVEVLPVLGGMLAVGIPAFRLPREILQEEIDGIRAMGVEMKTNALFSFAGNGKSIRKLGFDAAFLSIGAHLSLKMNIPGEKSRGVYQGVDFLREVNLGKNVVTNGKVAVIGGGNVAMDAARSALRLGAKEVKIYYRRSRHEMPAIPEEVEEALREGVKFQFLASPLKILQTSGNGTRMECIRMKLSEPDGTGRRKPIPIRGSAFVARADTIIAAIGQRVDRKVVKDLETNPDGTLRVHPETAETSMKGVFAGGDVVTGPGWAIDAIAAGKKGAKSIHEYLS